MSTICSQFQRLRLWKNIVKCDVPPLVREIEDSTMLIFRVPSKLCKPHDRNRAAVREA